MHKVLLLSGLLWLSATALAQGPITGFMPGAGVTDIAPGYSYESFNSYYFGRERLPATNTLQSLSLFIEHGLSDSLSIVLTAPYIWNARNQGNLQDATIALKYRNLHRQGQTGAFSLIGAAGITFPAAAYTIDSLNPIGIRATTLNARLVGQYNWYSGAFVHLQTGYDLRILPDVLHAVPVLLRGGFGAQRYYVEAWVEWFHTFNSGADVRISGGQGADWLRAGGTLYVPLASQFGIFAGAAQIFSGRNIGRSTRLNAGVVLKVLSRGRG
ncbi:MAG: hypothetical protein KF852_09470 [Saprospiraceae bacterium]|nr:hypothetical protein [Saprospiraceae bacterium]